MGVSRTSAPSKLPSVFGRIGIRSGLPIIGTETGAGGEDGTLIDAPFEDSIMTKEGVKYFRTSNFFGNLLSNVHEFVKAHPRVVLAFIDAFEYRRATPGFPEFPIAEAAFERVIETIFKDEPTEDALTAARALVRCDEREFQRMRESHPQLLTYLEKVSGCLARLSLVRPDVIKAIFRNIHHVRQDMLVYVAALHIEYTDRRDDVPF